jgi:hypothetical protein
MRPREGRDDDIRQPESELRGESLYCCCITGIESRVSRGQITMIWIRRSVGARIVRIRIHRDRRNIARHRSQVRKIRKVVRMVGHRGNVIVRTTAFVVTEEEDRVCPLRARREGTDNFIHFHLPQKDRLPRPRMLVIVAVTCFDECKARKRAIGQVRVELRNGRNVGNVDAEGIRWIAHCRARRLCWRSARRARWVFVHILKRILQRRKVSGRIFRVRSRRRTVIFIQTEALRDCVVDLPGNICGIQFIKDRRNRQLRKVVIATWILDQALRRATREGGDTIVNALARYGREPPVRQSELRCHEVVVVQCILIVIPHCALSGCVGEIS